MFRTLAAALVVVLIFTACDEPGQCVKEQPVPGTLGFGEPCIFDRATENTEQPCKPGLWCSGYNDNYVGYCTYPCEQSAECPVLNPLEPLCRSYDGQQRSVCIYWCSTDAEIPCPPLAQKLECLGHEDCRVPDDAAGHQ